MSDNNQEISKWKFFLTNNTKNIVFIPLYIVFDSLLIFFIFSKKIKFA
jgi:hypothetical protein